MLQGFNFFRAINASHGSKKAGYGGLGLVLVLSVVVVGLSCSTPVLAQKKSEGDHNQNDCPPETKKPMNNCNDVRQAAYALALKRGYTNSTGNSIPDVMERQYRVGWNDCSTGNAHMACMFNDPCTSDKGELQGMRSQSAWHATTMFKGKDGKSFECDFTPQSSGIMIANRGDTRIGPAFPDAGESMDPQYQKDGCPMNGATTALNPGGMFGGGGGIGGGGGSMQDMMMMMMLMQLLKGQQNQNGSQPAIDGQPATDEVVVPTPTPTPTPKPKRIPTVVAPSSSGGPSKSSTTMSDAGIVAASVDHSSDEDGSSLNSASKEGGSGGAEVNKLPTAAWEEKRGDLF
jgi:hypothetical protein